MAQLVEALRYKRYIVGSIPDEVIGISIDIIFSVPLWP